MQNLRRIYEAMFEDLRAKHGPTYPSEKIYQALTRREDKLGELSPHSQLLKAAGFTFYQTASNPDKHWNPSQYPYIRATILKSREMFEIYEKFLSAYMKCEIPHPSVQLALKEIESKVSDKFDDKRIRKETKRILDDKKL